MTRILRTALALLALTPALAVAAPPPPAPMPPALQQPVDGYDLQVPWQLWIYWIEGQKGAATEVVLAEPDAIDGERPWGAPILRFTKTEDFGHFLTGEVRVYCRPKKPYGFEDGSCHYRLRRAFVPLPAGPYKGDNPVSAWARDNFDTARLTRHFREAGIAPDTDWWMTDRRRLFATMPSPAQVLIDNATVIRLDSRDCPAFGRAIEALDGRTARWRMDMLAVGRDGELTPPAPHSVMVEYSLTISAPGRAGRVTIKGAGDEIERLVAPVLDAADACETAAA